MIYSIILIQKLYEMQVCILVPAVVYLPPNSLCHMCVVRMEDGRCGWNEQGRAGWGSRREPGRPVREFGFYSRCSEEPLKDSGQGNVMPWLSIKHRCGWYVQNEVKRARWEARPSVKRLDKSRCSAGDDTASEGRAAPQCASTAYSTHELFIPPDNPMTHTCRCRNVAQESEVIFQRLQELVEPPFINSLPAAAPTPLMITLQ